MPAGVRAVEALALVALYALMFAMPRSAAADHRRTIAGRAVASAYSRHSSGPRNGCDGSRLHDRDLSVATFLVPCGAHLRVCYRRRCVRVVRRDSGPYVRGRQLDLNVGVVRRLGFRSAVAWGVRTVTWRRVP